MAEDEVTVEKLRRSLSSNLLIMILSHQLQLLKAHHIRHFLSEGIIVLKQSFLGN